jgi:hypothetical protein
MIVSVKTEEACGGEIEKARRLTYLIYNEVMAILAERRRRSSENGLHLISILIN